MGYNTIALFSNDAYDQFSKHPEKTVENIKDGMNGGHGSYKGFYNVGNHANPMKVMKPRHADDSCVYVYAGNTLCEMNSYSRETEDLMNSHPEFFKEMLDLKESRLKSLKKEYKKVKSNSK